MHTHTHTHTHINIYVHTLNDIDHLTIFMDFFFLTKHSGNLDCIYMYM